MIFDSLALFDLNPLHIGFVLILALLLFGPQKLPEIGKQIGNALRELKKAGSEMVNTFNVEHEPEDRSYDHSYQADDYGVPRTDTQSIAAAPDLSDYTIAGQPVQEPLDVAYRSSDYENDYSASGPVDDYTIAAGAAASKAAEVVPAESSMPKKEEVTHV